MRITWIIALAFCGVAAAADTIEIEALLFVQNPQPAGPRPGIAVVWIPQPLLKYCLGKTAKECATIDYCNRTTNRDVPMCKNVVRLRPFPADMHPRRQLSITYSAIVPETSPVKGIAMLQTFYNSLPPASFDRLSNNVRIKARVKLTRLPNDDDFDILEYLAVGPFPN